MLGAPYIKSFLKVVSAYFSIFISAFIAATLLPVASELTLVALALSGYDVAILWLCATLGNTLGAVVNWGLARFFLHYQNRRWFPVSGDQLLCYQHWFQKYGVYSLLLAWLPLVGDCLTFAAGAMRIRLSVFIVLVGVGKGVRYLVVLWIAGFLV